MLNYVSSAVLTHTGTHTTVQQNTHTHSLSHRVKHRRNNDGLDYTQTHTDTDTHRHTQTQTHTHTFSSWQLTLSNHFKSCVHITEIILTKHTEALKHPYRHGVRDKE